jgi:hypothetical protein
MMIAFPVSVSNSKKMLSTLLPHCIKYDLSVNVTEAEDEKSTLAVILARCVASTNV